MTKTIKIVFFIIFFICSHIYAYQEPRSVANQYPNPSLSLHSPLFFNKKTIATSQVKMMRFITNLSYENPYLEVKEIGFSQEGRTIPLLVFKKNDSKYTVSCKRIKKKPTVLIVGQQHGNEPAGSEVALAIAGELTYGKLKLLLNDLNILIIPRANPDGATHHQRQLKNLVDLNRDHLSLISPEAKFIAKVLRDFHPNVIIDCHEFSVADRWLQKFNVLQYYDVMIEYPTLLNYPYPLKKLSHDVFYKNIMKSLNKYSFSAHLYYTTSYDLKDRRVSMGGLSSDTLRNRMGLENSISFLIETRGVNIGFSHFYRRVISGYRAVECILKLAASYAKPILTFQHNLDESINNTSSGSKILIKGNTTVEKKLIAFRQPNTGVIVYKKIDWVSSLHIQPVLYRQKPLAYILPASENKVADHLKLLGVKIFRISKTENFSAKEYVIITARKVKKFEVRNIDQASIMSYKVCLKNTRIVVHRGDYYIPFAQPKSNLATILLEPENQSSVSSMMLISSLLKNKNEQLILPIFRIYDKWNND